MARPKKIGLDYFPVDTSWDIKMRLLKARYKLEGVGLIIELFQAIYREGYAIAWNEDSRILVSNEAGIAIERMDEIIGFAASKGIFDQASLEKGYLTSHGIQSRWQKACADSRRKDHLLPQEIDLLRSSDEFPPAIGEFPHEETPVNSEETPVNSEFSTQKRVKESKVNKNREREEEPAAAVAPSAPSPSFSKTTKGEAGEEKEPFGRFKRVMMTRKEYDDLLYDYGRAKVSEYVNRLDCRIENGQEKEPKSCVARIRLFMTNDHIPKYDRSGDAPREQPKAASSAAAIPEDDIDFTPSAIDMSGVDEKTQAEFRLRAEQFKAGKNPMKESAAAAAK